MENPETSATPRAGTLVREARLAAGVKAEDLCSSLRISTAALEAVEACQYNRLPGDPYVRALLGSIARFLGMDAQKLLRVYNHENGMATSEPSAAPYQDVSEVHLLAHRKLFIALLAVLLIALLFILAKVNSSSEKRAAQAKPAGDTLTVAIPPPSDSLPMSSALRPDSAIAPDSAASKGKADTAKAQTTTAKAKADSAAMAAKPAPATAPAAPTSRETVNRILIKALIDSAGFHAFHKGKWYMAETLSLGQQKEISRRDTVNIILMKARSMQLNFADTTVVPMKKRFKIIGKNLIYY